MSAGAVMFAKFMWGFIAACCGVGAGHAAKSGAEGEAWALFAMALVLMLQAALTW
jgi:hypothetical protein